MFGKKKEKDEEYYKTHMTDEELAEAIKKMEERKLTVKEKRSVKQYVSDTVDRTMDMAAAQVRQKYKPRWRKICNVETDDEIDYDNPVVSLEYFLCHPFNQSRLIKGRRDEVLAEMTEMQRQVYLTCTDLDGTPYTDIEKTKMSDAIRRGKKMSKRM